jgi:hypothetical protein
LTVPAAAYYLRGDECPRCLTTMERAESVRREAPAPIVPAPSPAAAPAAGAAD